MKVVKVDPNWLPAEFPGLKVGEEIEISDPSKLLELGQVELPKKAPEKKSSKSKKEVKEEKE
jgi:hypothetical protein